MNSKVVNYTLPKSLKAGEVLAAKSVRSVVAKLSREGAKAKGTKAEAVTKAKLIEKAGVDVAVLASLEKANKEALEVLAV